MKPRILLGVIAVLSLAAALCAGPRDEQWRQVNEAVGRGVPKTAIEGLDPIIASAMADKAYAEAIRAIGQRVVLEGMIEGNKPEERILRMQAEVDKAPLEMQPVMEAILGYWYWAYFRDNRGRFLQRTQTAEYPGPDLSTWDLARILAEVGKHFDAALADPDALQTTPVATLDDLIKPGSVPDNYRPTLFDFLVYEALAFYQTGEQAVVVAEDDFEIEATGPMFGDVEAFVAWNPSAGGHEESGTAGPVSANLKAIRLYQSLLRFHQSDTDRSAFLDADLARLTYGSNVALGDSKGERYKAALERFIKTNVTHEASARALAALAVQLKADGEPVAARQMARRGLEAFPAGAGAAQCFNLIQQIEAKTVRIDTERVWNAPWPTLDVTYRNVSKVFFRAVRVEFGDYVARTRWGSGRLERDELKALLNVKPVLEWSADLPATADFEERTEKLPSPTSLKPGLYAILAGQDSAFGEIDIQVSAVSVWVSDLALVTRLRPGGGAQGGLVVAAGSGEPMVGASVRFWQRGGEGRFEALPATQTDENGRFQFPAEAHTLLVCAEHGGHAISSQRALSIYDNDTYERADSQTVLFTDRALYRPGQTIRYKGVVLHYNQDIGKYGAEDDALHVTVIFKGANGEEIAQADHEVNAYGSFSGEFIAPRDRVMGAMTLGVEEHAPGIARLRVEEYKRPKFLVKLEPPPQAAKIGEVVTMAGKAAAYTGAAVGGAKVRWRVERVVQLPPWCWWLQPPASKAVAHGKVVTAADGTFEVRFPAEPDRSVPTSNEPVFTYIVHADVTDSTGETRSEERSVRAGYTALAALLSIDEWQTADKPVELAIITRSLDGDPQPADGRVMIHALKQPVAVERAPLQRQNRWWWGAEEPKADPTNPDSWEQEAVVATQTFKTDATGTTKVVVPLKAGIYRASLETKDRFGKKVTARHTVEVVDPKAAHYGVKVPSHFAAEKWSVEPGKTFTAVWGTGYGMGRAFVELECDGKVLKSYWTPLDRTQGLVKQLVTEKMRGGFTVRVSQVRENRAYFHERVVDVPWTNKELTLKWERFRSKLVPGQKETWTAVITGSDAQRSAAEMVATLYDGSLDQYQPHTWPRAFGVFRSESGCVRSEFQNARLDFQEIQGWSAPDDRDVYWEYRAFPSDVVSYNGWEEIVVLSPFEVSASPDSGYQAGITLAGSAHPSSLGGVAVGAAEVSPDLSKVTARKNLNETAFFFPHLIAGEDGVVRMKFTMPEALTEWKFLGFAHDKQLRAGLLTGTAVTAKDLMVEPNPPRFVREGDAIEFTVKVSNQSDQPQQGRVKLTFADAASLQSVDAALGNRATEQAFDVPAKQSRSYSWRIAVPDGMGFLTYKAVGATAQASDGEEGFLPVLSRRILVTESLPLPIRGKATKQFEFAKLLASGESDTLRSQSLTVQMVSQPAWYAVMALPYLMEYPYECSEQLFNRYYANALARHIANSDPKIRRVLDLWKGTPALDSPLTKNQDLKSVMLEETPWLRQAQAESQSRRNVGLLFDANRLDEETTRVLAQLAERQLADGRWSWFPGGRPSEYISLYIMTGFGRLRHLGAELDAEPAIKALGALDAWMDREYRAILKQPNRDEYVPNYTDALYLYGRSFFLEDRPVAAEHREAVDFFLRQSRSHWLEVDSRQSQAHLALALQRFGDKATARAIMRSMKERSVSNEELGMFWRDTELSWWWHRAPIETQALMIEAFAEVAEDAQAVEDCKVWLLKQKQTQDWKTTKATADAVYGLLLRGTNLLSSDALVEVSLGGDTIPTDGRTGNTGLETRATKLEPLEAGTGFYEHKFVRDEIKPAMGAITVKKTDEGVSWGSVHWQYLEDMAKVTPYEGTPLKLKKTLWLKQTTKKGQELVPVTGPVAVGDELVVRLELRTDRDMEYVHLKDQRGSGTEPAGVLSRYKYQDGLAYYESTRDTASHFFIDYLPKGVYVFEYSARVQLRGAYQSGVAEIQCMYAPEFNSHSESIPIEVK